MTRRMNAKAGIKYKVHKNVVQTGLSNDTLDFTTIVAIFI